MIGPMINHVGDDIAHYTAGVVALERLIFDDGVEIGILDESFPCLDQARQKLGKSKILDLFDMQPASLEPNPLRKHNVFENLERPLAVFEVPEDVNPFLVGPQVVIKTAEQEVSHD